MSEPSTAACLQLGHLLIWIKQDVEKALRFCPPVRARCSKAAGILALRLLPPYRTAARNAGADDTLGSLFGFRCTARKGSCHQ